MSPSAPKEGYPLTWPIGVPRTQFRRTSDFKVKELGRNLRFLADELRRLGALNAVISCTVPRRRDGFPLADAAEPKDPGVAVYFDRALRTSDGRTVQKSLVIPCDGYAKVAENLRAIAATIEALRAIERYGSATMIEQAYSGFAQLPPAPAGATPPVTAWWEVLGVASDATKAEIQTAYFDLARKYHPDMPKGSHARMSEINAARDAGLAVARA